jgi:Domain of unknown function (DUF4291)
LTWIKLFFLWTMYRSGWVTKPDQERVLAIQITREGFEGAPVSACLSRYARTRFPAEAAWRETLRTRPVRGQWDPERDAVLNPLPHRAVRIGLSGEAVDRCVDEWITSVRDVTPLAREVRAAVAGGAEDMARSLLPAEEPYPLSGEPAARIGCR